MINEKYIKAMIITAASLLLTIITLALYGCAVKKSIEIKTTIEKKCTFEAKKSRG